MTESPIFELTVVRDRTQEQEKGPGWRFIATTPQFPTLAGNGTTPFKAVDHLTSLIRTHALKVAFDEVEDRQMRDLHDQPEAEHRLVDWTNVFTPAGRWESDQIVRCACGWSGSFTFTPNLRSDSPHDLRRQAEAAYGRHVELEVGGE